jgi:hypothetical protein
MGHGDFDPATGRGALLLEDRNGGPHLVSGEDLGVYLKDELRTLRLVFLNACKTATSSARTGFDPYAGIATALVQAGVPAVVAMQFPISDEAAIAFAETFYQCVAQGAPVDAAVAEGRKVLWGGERSEWATPVLFLRSSDGQLFGAPAEARAEGVAVGASQPGTASTSAAPAAPDAPSDLWGSGSSARVFVAAVDQSVGGAARQLASALRKEGLRVADGVPPPHEEPEHAAHVRALVRTADLCVHVLGEGPGESIDPESAGAPLRTYPLEQLRLGLEAARAQLVLVPEQVDVKTVEPVQYAERLRELVRMPRDRTRFQLAVTARQQMKDVVLTRLREIDEARRAASEAGAIGSDVRTAFVDLHVTDLPLAAELIAYLGRRQIAPIMMPSSDAGPTQALAAFEANLAKVPLYLVVFGGVTRDWVTNRLTEAFQAVLKNPGARTRIAVYVAPPVKGADQVQFPRFCEVAANMSGFDASSIDALIARAAE